MKYNRTARPICVKEASEMCNDLRSIENLLFNIYGKTDNTELNNKILSAQAKLLALEVRIEAFTESTGEIEDDEMDDVSGVGC